MRILSSALAIFVLALLPFVSVEGAGLVPCGGPDEPACQTCHVVDLMSNVTNWLIAILGLLAGLIVIYAGIRLVISAGNASAMESAKSLMTNMIIGYTIVLAAWLIIDYGIRSLVEDSPDFGPWNTLACVEQPQLDLNRAIQYVDLGSSLGMFALTQNVQGNFGPNSGSGALGRCEVATTGDCSVSALQQAGFGRHAENAARIAGSESGCNPGAESRTDTTTDGRTYSVGTWQINLAAHPVQCTLRNGQAINLNCPSAFAEAGYRNKFNVRVQRITNETLYQQCVEAVKDPACNNQIAARLANRSGDMGDWACSARTCGVATSRNNLCPLR